ncbi:MAG TPA: CDP-alcohol phosphatidyltransferase family protein [Aeromicrobium sp.]|nr:CDP-alcohol phosphatidyltransferase family protein [Aeromicrobium sp.]HKY57508.1 CDP-alcohol phosphatidyltransferase family protein [Aeromicrobium sp.]
MHQVHLRVTRLSAAGWFVALLVVCAVVDTTLGLGGLGWSVGVVAGVVLAVVLARQGRAGLGPADQVTATRAVLAGGVAALVADGLVGDAHRGTLVAMAAVALTLDLVDGYVARRTTSASAFGARFDMEVDAFLIAVLSVQVAGPFGWWVLLIGAMRYLYVAAGRVLPWLRLPLPPRRSAKVVAAIQGVTLVVAASELLPRQPVRVALVVALVLLVESFGQDCWSQWRRRDEVASLELAEPSSSSRRTLLATVFAALVLWLALVQPSIGDGISAGELVRIPVEGLLLVGLAAVLPSPARRVAAVAAGIAVTLVILLRTIGAGFDFVLAREFHLLGDWPNVRKGYEIVRDTESQAAAMVLTAVAVVGALGLLVLVVWSALRVFRVVGEHRRESLGTVAALGVVWLSFGLVGGPAERVAAASSVDFVRDTVDQVQADQQARVDFGDVLQTDAFAGRSGHQLVGELQGKDVLLVWFESYGRTALEGPMSPGIRDVLATGDRQLAAAGYRTRSAFLTSPVVGAGSWLAHASLQSGVWTDTELRYSQLLASDRLSLTRAFEKGGWRTVFVVPANTLDWPEGARYYGFDKLYDSRNSGYAGPKFGYASMPDQYTLEHFRRTELARPDRRPVFAELDLVSSHYRWGKLPDLIDWKDVGDGSVFAPMAERGSSVDGRRDPKTSSRLYGASVEYTWRTIVSFLTTYPDPDRVVIVAGDHQPHAFVGGVGTNRDAPVTIIAQDPDVIRRIGEWNWQPGLHPEPDAPVWRMDKFRNRFFAAYGTGLKLWR